MSIGNSAFYGCSGLTSVMIPSSVTSIGSSAFEGCSGLTSVTISGSKTSIGSNVFKDCNNIFTVDFNSKTIMSDMSSKYGFKDIFGTQVQEYIVGDSINNISSSSFAGCSSLATITIGNSVTSVGGSAFKDCTGLKKVVVKDLAAWFGISFGGSSSNPLYYAHHLYDKNDNEIIDLVIPDSVMSIGNYLFYGCSGLTSVTIPQNVTTIGNSAFYGCSNLPFVSIPDNVTSIGSDAFTKSVTLYVNRGTVSLIALWNSGLPACDANTKEFLKVPVAFQKSNTQTTITLAVKNYYKEYTCTIEGETLNGDEIKMTGLYPGYSSNYQLKVSSGDVSYYGSSIKVSTLPISQKVSAVVKSASSLVVKSSYADGDAKVESQRITLNGKEIQDNDTLLTGLNPKTLYNVVYEIVVNCGDDYRYSYRYTYTDKATVTTNALTLKTSQPKVISVGNVVVSATSNIDDGEENVGFEWRRTDWTDDFNSNTGNAYLFEGTMEGYIRNLNTEKLWKYRPYYEANDGSRYYGEWVGIDPTNTSYFEPTVHTYAEATMSDNTATVKGYVQRGSDNVSVQGFKYWKNTANQSAAHHAPAVPSDAKTIEGEGRVMEVTLTGLDYQSEYSYVAFVKTTEGETFYGEVRSFSTGADPAGIHPILLSNDGMPATFNVYTLSGTIVRHQVSTLEGLPRGIYIVNHKKVMVK